MLTIIIISLLAVIAIIWNTNIFNLVETEMFKLKKYDTLFRIAGILTLFFVTYNIYQTELNNKTTNFNAKLNLYRSISDDFVNGHNQLIITANSPEINEFYLELIGLKQINKNDKIHLKELAFSFHILNHLSRVISILYELKNSDDLIELHINYTNRIKATISYFMRHPRFIQYWKIYKPIYSMKSLNEFMAENYKL